MTESGKSDQAEIEKKLTLLSQSLIEAYRCGDLASLRAYALQAGIKPPPPALNRLFAAVIQVFHPDRILQVMRRLSSLGPREAALFLRMNEPARPAISQAPQAAEDYGRQESYAYAQEDFGYAEWDEAGDERPEAEENYEEENVSIDIIEGIKRSYLGNLDAYPSPLELESLEGELDLSFLDINDAQGAHYLVYVTSLNLAHNRISDCGPLALMTALEILDLSDNLLEDADALAALECLVELDLGGNDIESFEFLEGMDALRFVNASGNPPMPSALRTRLEKRGIIVIQ